MPQRLQRRQTWSRLWFRRQYLSEPLRTAKSQLWVSRYSVAKVSFISSFLNAIWWRGWWNTGPIAAKWSRSTGCGARPDRRVVLASTAPTRTSTSLTTSVDLTVAPIHQYVTCKKPPARKRQTRLEAFLKSKYITSFGCRRGIELAHVGPCMKLGSINSCPYNCTSIEDSEATADKDAPICGSDGNAYRYAIRSWYEARWSDRY